MEGSVWYGVWYMVRGCGMGMYGGTFGGMGKGRVSGIGGVWVGGGGWTIDLGAAAALKRACSFAFVQV